METPMTATLIAKARAGDHDAFRALTDPYRRALQVHCYRMLGSYHDAEEVLQETLLAAWQGLPRFEERASLLNWLYKIATNRSLNARRAISRRPAKAWDIAGIDLLEPTRLDEVVWLEPFPDAVIAGAVVLPEWPDARIERTETISLAFVKALQLLPPRQIAVLILRDVIGFSAEEVAGMLDASLDAVNSALKRARAGLEAHRPDDEIKAPAAGSPAEDAIIARFVTAWERADLDALVSALTDDVFMAMPPMPYEYLGRDIVRQFCANTFSAGRRLELVRTRANGQPAFGVYMHAPGGCRGIGLYVLTLAGDRICGMTRFESRVLAWFGLPLSLSDGAPAEQ
jgi:RNA polymerase sigma-70 factor (ECF subfamily)